MDNIGIFCANCNFVNDLDELDSLDKVRMGTMIAVICQKCGTEIIQVAADPSIVFSSVSLPKGTIIALKAVERASGQDATPGIDVAEKLAALPQPPDGAIPPMPDALKGRVVDQIAVAGVPGPPPKAAGKIQNPACPGKLPIDPNAVVAQQDFKTECVDVPDDSNARNDALLEGKWPYKRFMPTKDITQPHNGPKSSITGNFEHH